MRFFARIMLLLTLLPGVSSCLYSPLELVKEVILDTPNILEPNYQVTFTLNGEDYKHTSTGIPLDGYVSFTQRWINNDKFLDISFNADTPTLFSKGVFFKLTSEAGIFIQHKTYPIQDFRVVNKYGHRCDLSGEGKAYFNLDGLKNHECFEVFFEADCLDPDTQELYRFRNGRILCCKNSIPSHRIKERLQDYIKAD